MTICPTLEKAPEKRKRHHNWVMIYMFTKKSPTNIDYTSSVSSATKAVDTHSLIWGAEWTLTADSA
jgi:hypothetical protein